MSIALQGAGLSFEDYRDPLCQHGHARGAESLANETSYVWGEVTADDRIDLSMAVPRK